MIEIVPNPVLEFVAIVPTVKITKTIERTLIQVDAWGKRANFKTIVISGKRDPEHQLRIMRDWAAAKGIAGDFILGMTCKATDRLQESHPAFKLYGNVYAWQPMWSRLCFLGLIISPCFDAKPLEDYIYFGRNLKGLVVPASNHIPGNAFDLAGGSNGIADEKSFLIEGVKAKVITTIKNPLIEGAGIVAERSNNCCHVNCIPFV